MAQLEYHKEDASCILYCIHNTNTDRRCAMNVTLKHTQVLEPMNSRFSSSRCVSAASTILQNGTPKLAGQYPESISQETIYYSNLLNNPALPQVTKPLRSCSRKRVRMIFKTHESWNQMSLPIYQGLYKNEGFTDWKQFIIYVYFKKLVHWLIIKK